jgi:tetratricopeptide (TPR) repeat protein/O-antigen ligase
MSSGQLDSATANLPEPSRVALRVAIYCVQAFVAAALVVTTFLLTERTSLSEEVLITAGGSWLVGSILGAVIDVRRGAVQKLDAQATFNLTTLFYAVIAATFTIHAVDAVGPPPSQFNANAPEDLHGLTTNFTPYFLVLMSSVVLFVAWYGRTRERELEAGVATLIVYTSLAFELMLRTAGTRIAPESGLLSMPLLWGPMLVLLGIFYVNRQKQAETLWNWTPFGGPILLLLAGGLLSTIASVYVHASVTMLLRITFFAVLFWLMANATTGERQLRLWWLAIVGPLVGAAFVILLKLQELHSELGWHFVLTHRYQISGIAGTNPIGLSMGVAILLCVGVLVARQSRSERSIAALCGLLLLPAFLATHSPESLVALVGGLGLLVGMRYAFAVVKEGRRKLGRRIALLAAGVALLLALLAIPNPYTEKLAGDVLDPSTGRSARALAWQISFDNFRENPVLGVGLHNYYGRTRYVDDFPSSVMTGVRERRVLLGSTIDPWKNFVSFHPHNAYLAIIEGVGILGAGAILWLGYVLVAQALRLARRASGSFLWWSAAVPVAAIALTLAWSFVAQGEDVSVIAIPFWPLLGFAAGAWRVLMKAEGIEEHQRSDLWQRLTARVAQWDAPALRRAWAPATGALGLLALLMLVARPVAADVLAKKSSDATEVRQDERALDLITWAHRLDPWNAAYLGQYSDAEIRTGSLANAIERAEEVIKTRRYYAPDHVHLGWLYWLRNQPDVALGEFQYAVELDRWDTTGGGVYTPLGVAHAHLGHYEEALDAFAYGVRVSPAMLHDAVWLTDTSGIQPVLYLDPVYLAPRQELDPDIQRNIVRRLGFAAQKPIQREPTTSPDYRITAVLDAIHDDYQVTVQSDRDTAGAMLQTLGRLARSAGLPGRAVTYYEELQELGTDPTVASYGLGVAYMASGDAEAARNEFQHVLVLSDESSEYVLREPFSHFYLGVLALQAQPPDTETALTELREAVDTYRWDYLPHLYAYLAVAEQLSGNPDKARREIGKELFLLGTSRDSEPLEAAAETDQSAER